MKTKPTDAALVRACAQVLAAQQDPRLRPEVQSWFDPGTHTVTYLVGDAESRVAAIIDSVLDFDAAAGRSTTAGAEAVAAAVRAGGWQVGWQLETHAHADHLSAAPYLKQTLGGRIGIGRHIADVQAVFARVFNLEAEFVADGRQFDHLFDDGDQFQLGSLPVTVLHVPGHTPACVAYLVGDAIFVGDTLFMPDYGTARCDFPGGDARHLYRSIRRLLALPDATRVFLCHDYKAEGRDHYAWETTIGAQRRSNVHVHDGVAEDEFVAMRRARDQGLAMPKLMLPSVQVNIRAGRLPPAESNGVQYLKLPLNQF